MELKLLNQNEVAAKTGMHRHTIAAWVEKGFFPKPHVVSGRCKHWTRKQIETYLKNNSQRKNK